MESRVQKIHSSHSNCTPQHSLELKAEHVSNLETATIKINVSNLVSISVGNVLKIKYNWIRIQNGNMVSNLIGNLYNTENCFDYVVHSNKCDLKARPC